MNKSKPQREALICALVSDLRDGPPAQSFVDTCSGCGKAVWRAMSSPKRPTAMCGRCMLMQLQLSGTTPVIEPPTKRQRADIKKYYEG